MKILVCMIIICFIATTLSAPFDEIEPKQATPNYRLPDNVIPSNYDIEIEPFFSGPKQFTFDGFATITLRAVNTTNQIVLHYNELIIDEQRTTLTLVSNPGSQTVILGTNWDNVTHLYTLTTAVNLTANVDYRLSFIYTGILSDDMSGFYRSSYVENQVTK